MAFKSIEEHLSEKFGYDQYQAYDHANKNRSEIESSEKCACYFCYEVFPPKEIVNWTDNGNTACCPKCGLGNVVIGSASGIPFEREFLELVHAHWF